MVVICEKTDLISNNSGYDTRIVVEQCLSIKAIAHHCEPPDAPKQSPAPHYSEAASAENASQRPKKYFLIVSVSSLIHSLQ